MRIEKIEEKVIALKTQIEIEDEKIARSKQKISFCKKEIRRLERQLEKLRGDMMIKMLLENGIDNVDELNEFLKNFNVD
ncbi:MAG: hypothetical protein ACI4I4_00405 [Acutalibacteraceae bacterium]